MERRTTRPEQPNGRAERGGGDPTGGPQPRGDSAPRPGDDPLADAADGRFDDPYGPEWHEPFGEPRGDAYGSPRDDRYGSGRPPRPDLSALFVLIDALRRGLPPEMREQFTSLLREALMTLRSLIDWYLERLDTRPRETRVEDIPID